jgi:hypothetical protein
MLLIVQLVTLDTQLQPVAHAKAGFMTQMLMLIYSFALHALPTALAAILVAVQIVILGIVYQLVLVVQLDTMITLVLAHFAPILTLTV